MQYIRRIRCLQCLHRRFFPTRDSTSPPPAPRHLGPNWYAPVMGTAIVATAGAGLPLDVPGLRTACTAVWALALLSLAVLLGARALHWAHHNQARAHLLDPAVAPFRSPAKVSRPRTIQGRRQRGTTAVVRRSGAGPCATGPGSPGHALSVPR